MMQSIVLREMRKLRDACLKEDQEPFVSLGRTLDQAARLIETQQTQIEKLMNGMSEISQHYNAASETTIVLNYELMGLEKALHLTKEVKP